MQSVASLMSIGSRGSRGDIGNVAELEDEEMDADRQEIVDRINQMASQYRRFSVEDNEDNNPFQEENDTSEFIILISYRF